VIAVFAAIAALIVAVAAAFVVWPARRGESGRARVLLAAALGLFVAGVGGGLYLLLGHPGLGVRALEGNRTHDLNGMIAVLARHLHERPDDAEGWTLLGGAYLRIGDTADAVKAYEHAIPLTRAHPRASLYADYGLALVSRSQSGIPREAEMAFANALALDPRNIAARYFLGYVFAARGENAKALALWQSLLADSPRDAPYRRELVDRIAMLSAATGAMPDVAAMVSGLAARLKAQPNDPPGWLHLIRAYAVMGDKTKAAAALAEARKALARDGDAEKALTAEARQLQLEK
jgi:cytochrome c-type biogenesis protein CcmH